MSSDSSKSREIPSGGVPEVVERFTGPVMTNYGGAGLLRRFARRLGIAERLRAVEGLPQGRLYRPVDYLLVIVLGLLLGRGGQSQIADLRDDPACRMALGLPGVPSQPSLSRFFARCTYQVSEQLARVNRQLVAKLREGYRSVTIDLDGHVISTRGEPERANYGYNPKRKGARSYFALFGFLAEGRDLVEARLLPGNRATVRSTDALYAYRRSRSAVAKSVRRMRLRADSAFYSNAFLSRLEKDRVTYFVAVPGREPMRPLVYGARYRRLDGKWAVAEFEYQGHRWKQSRRFVVIRERLEADNSNSQQRRLFGTERYGYQIIATNSGWAAQDVWRFYNRRCVVENIIKESGHDFAADHIVSQCYSGNRVWLILSVLAYNLGNWFREKVLNQHAHRTMAFGLRRTLIELPARLIYHARQWYLQFWCDHPSRNAYERAQQRLATLAL
jgi:hypothetical protein